MRTFRFSTVILASLLSTVPHAQQPAASTAGANPRLDQYKRDVGLEVDGLGEMVQQMVDQIFSYGELGFQEFETTKYLTGILKKNGFTIQDNVAGHSDRAGWRRGDRASR